MGVGGAFIMPATLSIITAVFTDHAERTRAIGLWSAVSGLGVAIGPVAGGWLLTHFSWDSIFLVNLPIVAIALVAGHWLIPASRAAGSAGRLDLAGAALSVAAFTGLTYTIIEAPSHGWLSVWTLGLGALSIALLALFVAWEARAAHPMLPLRLFRNPRFTGAGLFGGERHHAEYGQRAGGRGVRQHHGVGVRGPYGRDLTGGGCGGGAPGGRGLWDCGAARGGGRVRLGCRRSGLGSGRSLTSPLPRECYTIWK